jgi:hypothetical protein
MPAAGFVQGVFLANAGLMLLDRASCRSWLWSAMARPVMRMRLKHPQIRWLCYA